HAAALFPALAAARSARRRRQGRSCQRGALEGGPVKNRPLNPARSGPRRPPPDRRPPSLVVGRPGDPDHRQGAADHLPVARRAPADASKTAMDLVRAEELRAQNAFPQERLDNAEVAAQSVQAQLTQARAQLAAAEEQKRAAESRVSEAQGRVEQSTPISAQIA